MDSKIKPLVLIHGGAWDIPKTMHDDHLQGIRTALELGQQTLRKTNDAVQTVIEVIKYLENNPTYDAGTGSFLNSAGEVEMDAGIMIGKNLSAGCVAAIQNVRHPIEVANAVREKTQHVMLVGEGATGFARQNKFEMLTTDQLLVGREKELYEELKARGQVRIKTFFEVKNIASDTVGAVVMNDRGEIVAGTSTGGTPHKLQGRVGDSPIIGSGFYADDRFGGASCTGWGEGIMRVMLAKTAIDLLKNGITVREAARLAIEELSSSVSGEGGIILIDPQGQYASAFNTPFMARGAADLDTILFTAIE